MTDSYEGEIKIELLDRIIKTLPKLSAIHSPDNTILVQGMGGQPRRFYRELRQNFNIELLWTGWSSKLWWTYLFSFIPGQAGLVKVKNIKQLDSLYIEIGGQNLCGLYFLPDNKVKDILADVKKTRGENINKIMENETNYFLLTVDFGFFAGEKDGENYYEKLILGENLDKEIKYALLQRE